MKATLMYAAADVRVENVPDAAIENPTDAIVRVTRACICGSDLHPFHSMPARVEGRPMGHEYIGVVEDIGSEVTTVKKGDFVVATFAYQDNSCVFCREGMQTSCIHGGLYGNNGVGGGQADAVRTPWADGSLVKVPGHVDESLYASLLALTDVYLTGYHAVRMARVEPGKTVTVVGDGAVGLLAVMAAKRLGAERIILMGRHTDRTDLGVEFGATDVVAERGDEGVAAVRELTNGEGSHVVIEAVGLLPAYHQSYGIVRPGGTISRVGVPQYTDAPVGFASLFGDNITLTGGIAPVRAYIDGALPDVLEGRIDPGRVFDRTVSLDDTAAGYRAMDARDSLKVIVEP